MTASELFSKLLERGVSLRIVDNEQLSVSAPKGALSSELLQALRDLKPEIVRLLKTSSSGVSTLPTIQPNAESIGQPFPLADLQAAFIMGERPDMEHHVRPHYYVETDHAELDPVRYTWALNSLLERQVHNLPRLRPDLTLQCGSTFTRLPIAVNDFRSLEPNEAEAALLKVRTRLERSTLPLDHWPWLGCEISLHPGGARIHYNNNNFFSDGYGTQTLLDATWRKYQDPKLELAPLELSFRDCVVALAELEGSELGLRSRDYWLSRIPELPSTVAIPRDPRFDARTRSRLRRRKLVLPASTWSALKERARGFGLTPTNCVYSIYAETLAHYSGQRHFLLNNMVTHRFPMHPQVKEVLGNFASLYPLEVDWRHAEPFFERARRLQQRLIDDLQHVYWKGVSVLQALNHAQQSTGRAPCPFVVGSGLFMGPVDPPVHSCLETPQVVLDNQFWETSDGRFWAVWDVVEEAFPSGLIDSMWHAFERLLQCFAESGEAWQQQYLGALTSAELQARTRANDTLATDRARTLLEGLLSAGNTRGNAEAVRCRDDALTNSQLLERSLRAAGLLGAAGLTPGDRVVIVGNKCVSQIVAVYGILLGGGVYVPTDPNWPEERIAQVVRSSGARILVGFDDTLRLIAIPAGTRLVDLSDGGAFTPSPAVEQVPAESLGYVIYTSGSTGVPKGVAIAHGAAMNTIVDINDRFAVGPEDCLFGISSLAFDLSVYDVFGAAAAGARLLLPDVASLANPRAWLHSVRAERVTIWNSVPALMQLLVDAALSENTTLPELRLVLLSGDWIPVALPEKIRQVAPHATIVSLGGATEASIWSICHVIGHVDPEWTSIPYGTALRNQNWHVLNEHLSDAPTWVPGELYISGGGLALGYFNDAERTERSFIERDATPRRLYKTGDLGRFLPDGGIELLGRIDHQVKISGYRVELGEIEHALSQLPGIAQCTVIARQTTAGKQLCAFVVLSPESRSTSGDVQQQLTSKLPSYMVPSNVVFLSQLPLTANGKLDRSALERTAPGAGAECAASIAPRTTTETLLTAIWAEVIGLEIPGVNSDFFQLGGQSFAALRILNRIQQELGVTLPLGAILEGRTVAKLAARIEAQPVYEPLVKLNGATEGRPLYLVHPAGGGVLCYRTFAERCARPVYGLQSPAFGVASGAPEDVEGLARLYAQSLLHSNDGGSLTLGGWSSGGVIAHAIAQQLEAGGHAVDGVLLFDTPAPVQLPIPSPDQYLAWFIEDLDQGVDAPAALDEIRRLTGSSAQKLEHLLPQLASTGKSALLDVADMSRVFQVFCTVVSATRTHSAGIIRAPICLVRASESRVTEYLSHPFDGTRDWGWSRFTSAEVNHRVVAGTHHQLFDSRHLPATLAAASELLRT